MFTLGARPVPALLGVIFILLGALLLLSVKAFTSSAQEPTFTSVPSATAARFAIPQGSDATWTLRVWSGGQLMGSTRGTSGTLSVSLPAPPTCHIQADIRTTRPGGSVR